MTVIDNAATVSADGVVVSADAMTVIDNAEPAIDNARRAQVRVPLIGRPRMPRRRSAAKFLSKDKARRIAANIAKLPELLRRDTLERVIFTFA